MPHGGGPRRTHRSKPHAHRRGALDRRPRARNPAAGGTDPVGFETVTVVTRDGRKVRGTRKNEDTFSIQLMTGTEDLITFLKRDLTEVVPDEQSLMPSTAPNGCPMPISTT